MNVQPSYTLLVLATVAGALVGALVGVVHAFVWIARRS